MRAASSVRGHHGLSVLFAARTALRNAGLMGQPLESTADFLTDSGRSRVDFLLFSIFRHPARQPTRRKSRSEFNGLLVSAEKYERFSHFSLGYVTRITYE
jgi:hypothetical protein